MRIGEKLMLAAIDKEIRALSRKATRLENEINAYHNANLTREKIMEELNELINDNSISAIKKNAKIDTLSKRRNEAVQAGKKDILKLIEKQSDVIYERDELAKELQKMKFIFSMRYGAEDTIT